MLCVFAACGRAFCVRAVCGEPPDPQQQLARHPGAKVASPPDRFARSLTRSDSALNAASSGIDEKGTGLCATSTWGSAPSTSRSVAAASSWCVREERTRSTSARSSSLESSCERSTQTRRHRRLLGDDGVAHQPRHARDGPVVPRLCRQGRSSASGRSRTRGSRPPTTRDRRARPRKVVTITSTYDTASSRGRVGPVPRHMAECLTGKHGFYDEVFDRWACLRAGALASDVNAADDPAEGEHARLAKQVRVQTLINIYRVRGHLIATDPSTPSRRTRTPSSTRSPTGSPSGLPRRFVATGGPLEWPRSTNPPRPARRLLPTLGIEYCTSRTRQSAGSRAGRGRASTCRRTSSSTSWSC